MNPLLPILLLWPGVLLAQFGPPPSVNAQWPFNQHVPGPATAPGGNN